MQKNKRIASIQTETEQFSFCFIIDCPKSLDLLTDAINRYVADQSISFTVEHAFCIWSMIANDQRPDFHKLKGIN